ncbi:ABC transporter ATP-binding protein [Desulfosoma sp.]
MIEARNLVVRYPHQQKPVLRGVDMECREGELTLLCGATGSGKSSLCLALCGVIPHFIKAEVSGLVRLGQFYPWDHPLWQTSRIVGLLMQAAETMVFTDRVADEIAFGLENAGVPAPEIDQRMQNVVDFMGIAHLAGRSLRSLSCGELQRVVIAALLVLDQRFLILDEPFAYLDRPSCRRLLELFSFLCRTGKAVFVIEHRHGLFHDYGFRPLFLAQGRLEHRAPCPAPLPSIPRTCAGNVLLEFDSVDFDWGGDQTHKAPLLRGVTFQVRAGESVVLSGENGSGKTTLFLLAMGLVKPLGGIIRACGVLPAEVGPRVMARCAALVLQAPQSQLFMATVWEEIQLRAADEASAMEELHAFDLHALRHRHPRSLSAGQMRRVTLAAAFAARPKLLLLDEPSVGQDDEALGFIIRRLGRFVEEGGGAADGNTR